MTRTVHRVAIVVFAEAEGVDEYDASAGARMAITRALTQAGNRDELSDDFPSSLPPACDYCGLAAGVTTRGRMKSHYRGEHGPVRKEYADNRCQGSGTTPRIPQQPVVGFRRASDDLRIAARIHDVMEVGMAAGNGYLWQRPTIKGFRS